MPRLAQGDLINPSGRATPLSVRYDPMASAAVTRAIDALRVRGNPWRQARVKSPAGDSIDRGGLTEHERAFQQAVFREPRVYRHGRGGWTDEDGRWHQNPNPERTHAVQCDWDDFRSKTTDGGTMRTVRIRVRSIGEASLHGSETWT